MMVEKSPFFSCKRPLKSDLTMWPQFERKVHVFAILNEQDKVQLLIKDEIRLEPNSASAVRIFCPWISFKFCEFWDRVLTHTQMSALFFECTLAMEGQCLWLDILNTFKPLFVITDPPCFITCTTAFLQAQKLQVSPLPLIFSNKIPCRSILQVLLIMHSSLVNLSENHLQVFDLSLSQGSSLLPQTP